MTPAKKGAPRQKAKPGPKAESLKIEGDWKDAVRRALGRGKPPAKAPAKKKKRN
jgi:hypothetical protein